MSEHQGVSPAALASLRGRALVDALEYIDEATIQPGEIDLNALIDGIAPDALGQDDFRRLLAAVNRISDSVAEIDLTVVDARVFVRLVAGVSHAQLESALAVPESRARLLDEIFRRMETHVRSDRVKRMHSVVRWRLTGGNGTGGFDRYESVLADGTCTVSRELTAQPRVTITVSPADFVQLITGQATPPVLFVTGKIQVKGDLGFAAGLIGYFDLPTS
ncbi:MAG: SCP2 sterol-binding domain-containing protein [Haloechinothrix sp.]